jgi:hypothetical protein
MTNDSRLLNTYRQYLLELVSKYISGASGVWVSNVNSYLWPYSVLLNLEKSAVLLNSFKQNRASNEQPLWWSTNNPDFSA